ncbi:uncharacterized protein LOC115700177 [Cannabis sativa]|uniref:uncharacterized protein LOC115700177 n=1 Tax=Cannabis sativa TaxID=3483 RepID=UPI0029CA8CA0|nr:uncharacterized protein LOC115700177 [Cannabis sativa]
MAKYLGISRLGAKRYTLVGGKWMQYPCELNWDVDLLHDIFDERNWWLITKISLNLVSAEDHYIRSEDGLSTYTVKSAYALLQSLKGQWYEGADSKFWQRLWSLKEEDETILHILVSCPVTRKCWERVGIGTATLAGSSFFDWCTTVFNLAAVDLCCKAATICWAIWGARNELVWKGKGINPEDIVAFANCYLDQWRCAQSSEMESLWSLLQTRNVVECWTAPWGNSIKINVDTTLFNNGDSYGIGLVVRNGSELLIERHIKLFFG